VFKLGVVFGEKAGRIKKMGLHYEERGIGDGTIDNRTRGTTILKINFTNHTSSLITLQGDLCRDLAGSFWKFSNPFAEMEEKKGVAFSAPSLSEGSVGRITYSRKKNVPQLPPEEHYDMLFDDEEGEPPTKVAPVLELEWFTPKFGQVEVDCERMTLELVEMVWAMTEKENEREEQIVNEKREEVLLNGEDFRDELDLLDDYEEDEPEPHQLEEQCFLIVQEFVVNSADGSEGKKELYEDLLKLQEQVAESFVYLNYEGGFDEVPETVKLLGAVLPFIDRATVSAQFVATITHTHLLELREGIGALREALARGTGS